VDKSFLIKSATDRTALAKTFLDNTARNSAIVSKEAEAKTIIFAVFFATYFANVNET
jgi:hypothetical protein